VCCSIAYVWRQVAAVLACRSILLCVCACVGVCCSVLQCDAVCCSAVYIWREVAAILSFCSMLLYVCLHMC